MSLVWERAPYSSGSLLVLLALADWSNEEGVSWPSMERLANKARIDKRSAQRIVRQLSKDGLLKIEEGGGRGKQHRFLIQIEKVTNCRPLSEVLNGDISSTETVTNSAQRVTFETERVTPVSSDPLVEPSVDPPIDPSERARPRNKPVRLLTENEFLSHLESNPAYAGIDVRRLNDKMVAWCEVNGKQPSRRRLVNWLNREERPMENGNGTHKPKFESSTERNVRNLRENAEYIRRLQNSDSETDREDPIGLLVANV